LGPAPVSDMRTVNCHASVSCHFASTSARSLNASLRIPLAVLDPVCASVWRPIFSRVFPRHVAARGANRRGPRGEPPRPSGFQPTFSLLYKHNCPFFFLFFAFLILCAQCFSPSRFRRSPSAVARSSFGARRTHAVLPPDFAVRESSTAPSPRPLHSHFSTSFSASPSTVVVGDRRPCPSPAKVFLSDHAAQGW
jgi:hypothetical protein